MRAIRPFITFVMLALNVSNVLSSGKQEAGDSALSQSKNVLIGVELCSKQPSKLMGDILNNAPRKGSNQYISPGADNMEALDHTLYAFIEENNLTLAQIFAGQADYTFCRGQSEEQEWLLLYPASVVSRGQAIILLNLSASAEKLILEVPHPYADFSTFPEAMAIFKGVNARAIILSGTHRCASNTTVGCDGHTQVCGGSSLYRVSDPAHNDESQFHTAHRYLADHFSEDLVVSVHGMGNRGISVSDGTTFDTDENSPVALLFKELSKRFNSWSQKVTSCNRFSGANLYRRLCGTSNLQGRHVNGMENVCTEKATASTSRFIHMEQSAKIRQSSNHGRMVSAFENLLLKMKELKK